MNLDELNRAMAESNADARYGRRVARLTFAVTSALVAFVFCETVLASPNVMGDSMFAPVPNVVGIPLGVLIEGLGFAGTAVGLIWMWRIVRADGDPHAPSWRHRRGL
ncbi:MAG TPA: hypothetical protein VFJ71_09255 [Candidatus Limnocylindrales bacterium]|nr:hypothetical protein [Candidatus Limnocylindrales bacterium]